MLLRVLLHGFTCKELKRDCAGDCVVAVALGKSLYVHSSTLSCTISCVIWESIPINRVWFPWLSVYDSVKLVGRASVGNVRAKHIIIGFSLLSSATFVWFLHWLVNSPLLENLNNLQCCNSAAMHFKCLLLCFCEQLPFHHSSILVKYGLEVIAFLLLSIWKEVFEDLQCSDVRYS